MPKQAPTLDEFMQSFSRYTSAAIKPDRGLFAQEGLNSVHAVEWLYGLEDTYDAELDAEAMSIIEAGTLRDLYGHLFAAVSVRDV